MKIGIIYCAFNCKNFVQKSLPGFMQAKKENIIDNICAVSLPFLEYAELNKENDGTTEMLVNLYKEDKIDYIFTQPNYIQEHLARDLCLQYLKIMEMDFVWLVDGDEFYLLDEIKNIVEYIKTKDYSWYSINFKNYIFDGSKWVDGFCPPRIFKISYNDFNIDKFYWDNDILYKNKNESCSYKNLPSNSIPKEIAHIKHMTWLHSNSKNKYYYQIKHFGDCSYLWNEKTQEVEFNLDYYKKHNLILPELKS